MGEKGADRYFDPPPPNSVEEKVAVDRRGKEFIFELVRCLLIIPGFVSKTLIFKLQKKITLFPVVAAVVAAFRFPLSSIVCVCVCKERKNGVSGTRAL